MTKKFAPSGATAKLCLPDVVTMDRRLLENALVDLDQSVAANDHLGYEAAYQTILAMIPQSSATMADEPSRPVQIDLFIEFDDGGCANFQGDADEFAALLKSLELEGRTLL